MTPIFRTGLLAFGLSGKAFHAPFLQAHPGFSLDAVTERSVKSASQRYPRVRSYDTIEALLTDPELDLIVVNTPNATHFDFARRALTAGKHVLLEKPFAISPEQARELFALADTLNLHVVPYQNRRYDTDFALVSQALASRTLGNIVEAHLRFDRYRIAIGPKIAKETPGPGAGLLWDLGPHLIDTACALFGHPLRWTRITGHFRPDTRVDDYAHIRLDYAGGLRVFLTTSLLVADPQPAFVLHGTQGSLVKFRADVQETQLLAGMLPNAPDYARESDQHQARLTRVTAEGATTTLLPQHHDFGQGRPPAGYLQIFDALHRTLALGEAYPITRDDILLQLEILSSADNG